MTKSWQPKALRVILPISFFMSVGFALPLYVQSSFLGTMVSSVMVSWYYVIAMAAGLVAMNIYPLLIARWSNYRVALGVVVVVALSLLGLAAAPNTHWALAWFILFVVGQFLMVISLDVFIERFTANTMTGRIRTTYYTVVNLGILISPFIISQLISWFGNYRVVFLFAAMWMIPVAVILIWFRVRLQDHVHYHHHHFLTTLRHVFARPDVRRIFGVSFLLEIFYAVAVVYMPIYLTTVLGFDWSTIGIIFTVMLIPFVVLEFPAGVLADRYLGEKGIMAVGFLILASSVLLWSLIPSSSAAVWALLLFLSRCGAALIEAMRETYFFKVVDVTDVDYIGFFRNTKPLAYLVSAGLAALFLSSVGISTLFMGLGATLIFGVWFALGLRDTRQFWRRKKV